MLEPFVQGAEARQCTSLRQVVCSGEGLPYDLTERFFEVLPDCRLANLYGPTEAAVDVTSWDCLREDPRRIVPIGRPIGNIACYVLDSRLEPAPVGTPGELYLSGIGLARGYFQRADLSAERFVACPFAQSERMYKTGDLARWLADGTLQHLGRLDGQVKIRGNRIELGDIEAALRSIDSVAEAACAAVDLGGNLTLAAYLVAAPEEELPPVESLREELSARLPAYMVPASFTRLDELPLTVSGKTDRKRLPLPTGGDRPRLEQEYVEPEGAAEIRLAEIFAEVLHVDRVGALDNYFALGGDSIRSIQVLAQARARQLHFTLPELFAQPTVRQLAALSLTHTAEGPIQPVKPLELVDQEDRQRLDQDVQDAYPLIELQAGMLFHAAYSPETAVYHDVFGCRIGAALDQPALRAALDTLTRRHDALRTRFALSGFSRPLQLVQDQAHIPLFVHDLTELEDKERQQALQEFTEQEKLHRFDWNQPPLLRLHAISSPATPSTSPSPSTTPSSTDGASPPCWPNCLVSIRPRHPNQLRFSHPRLDSPTATSSPSNRRLSKTSRPEGSGNNRSLGLRPPPSRPTPISHRPTLPAHWPPKSDKSNSPWPSGSNNWPAAGACP